jgi:hypothetical protein
MTAPFAAVGASDLAPFDDKIPMMSSPRRRHHHLMRRIEYREGELLEDDAVQIIA